MLTLFENIAQLVQVRPAETQLLRGREMDDLPVIENAFLLVENGIIRDFGPMERLPSVHPDRRIDATGRLVLPAWTDSHTHTVFPGSRYTEFMDKIRGLSYEEIAARGGGILNSARRLAAMSEDELLENAMERINLMMQYGTGALEIKSGYGLSVEGELKMLRVIRHIQKLVPIPVKATFLGAHAIPEGMQREDYVRMIVDEMLPEVGRHHLADYVDVFCEKGYFTPDDTARILDAATRYGLRPKLHVNQFSSCGCLQTAVRYGALSVDHLEEMRPGDYAALSGSDTIATALPGCSFFLGIPYTPLKQLIQHNIPVALATDFNPGSAPSFNMNFMVSLACIKARLTPGQAINAATLNAAAALELSAEMGSIALGKKARLILTRPLAHYGEIPYYFATNPVEELFV